MDLTSITPTPQALKALTHPVRLRMLGLLRVEGSATATQLATRLGLNSGATSYHLRQLATHGFITDDEERGNGRDRWWKAAHQATMTGREAPPDDEARETLDAYLQSVVTVLTEQLQRAVEERALLPDAWRAASEFSDFGIRLTPARAKALMDHLDEILLGQEEDDSDDAADFVVQLTAFPRPGTVTGDPS
ncbi:helix-turn-helix domain-containing protein [Nocardioides luti]|nr:helix-turn-helix domain-containing protein [Nocardioides luti]